MVALQSSNGPERQRQGELGYFAAKGRADLDPRLVEEAFRLRENEISPAEGWNVVELVGRTAAADIDSEQVKQAVRRRLEARHREEAFDAYLAELKAKAEIAVAEVQSDPVVAELVAQSK